jgi:hypothetical protein
MTYFDIFSVALLHVVDFAWENALIYVQTNYTCSSEYDGEVG